MENEFYQEALSADFSFLEKPDVQLHFADVNIALLGGRHIQTGEGYHFTLLNTYPDEFSFFYQNLYGLELKHARAESVDYYYLDFPQEGKGKLNSSDRFREMTAWELLFGLMLLNMYYERFFEHTKIITWTQLRAEIEESELTMVYRKAFFNEPNRDFFTDPEWKSLQDSFKRVLKSFERLGWVKTFRAEEDDGELKFQIRESIDRFGKLYEYEITDFDQFVTQINQKRRA